MAALELQPEYSGSKIHIYNYCAKARYLEIKLRVSLEGCLKTALENPHSLMTMRQTFEPKDYFLHLAAKY